MPDPAAVVVLHLVVILLAAQLGGDLAVRIGQPPVLGELCAGVLLGNVALAGFAGFEPIETDPFVDMFARVGVLLLLFEVGLQSTVGQMLRIGWPALRVAALGVAAPFLLGACASAWLAPDQSASAHLFVGATLTATSVGITARVLEDLGRSRSAEARVILGAAVIDDVLGLVILAVVVGVIASDGRAGAFSLGAVAWIFTKAALFLVLSLILGVVLSRRLFALAARLNARNVLLAVGLSFCFLLSWLAARAGLAPIVGAFAAGLILEDAHYRSFVDRGEHGLEALVHPISAFLVPVFFVLMGMRTDLSAFAHPGVPALAAALTVAAIAGKQACALGTPAGVDRLAVGIGMIPRGEVGLIFASVGLTLSAGGRRVVDEATYSAIVVMVIVTTLATPPALKWRMGHRR